MGNNIVNIPLDSRSQVPRVVDVLKKLKGEKTDYQEERSQEASVSLPVFRACLIIGMDRYVSAGVGGGGGEGNEGPALCFFFFHYLLAVLGLCCCSGLAVVSGSYSSCGATLIVAVSLVVGMGSGAHGLQ